MSKVQSPKSNTEGLDAAERGESANGGTQGKLADFGPGTLDFGLRVTDLRKGFLTPTGARVEVLRSVSFSVTAGETVSITGASGAGKSTLLHLLGGLEAADHGSIIAGEFRVHAANPAGLARFRNQQVGFIFQFHHLLSDLTAAENVSLPLRIRRVQTGEAMRRAEGLLTEFGLDRRASAALVGNLSGGEQQRVAVCRALVTRPSLVLADEPTGNLDVAIGDEIARLLACYARDNRAIVVIATHSSTLAAICDRTLALKNGRLSRAE